MLNHPYIMIEQAKAHESEVLAFASRRRLLRLAREWRNATRASAFDRKSAARVANDVASVAPVAAAPIAALAGTLAACGRHAVGSAR